MLRTPKKPRIDTFPDPVCHFGARGGHFVFCRRCDVAGGKRVPPAPLDWYSDIFWISGIYRHIYIEHWQIKSFCLYFFGYIYASKITMTSLINNVLVCCANLSIHVAYLTFLILVLNSDLHFISNIPPWLYYLIFDKNGDQQYTQEIKSPAGNMALLVPAYCPQVIMSIWVSLFQSPHADQCKTTDYMNQYLDQLMRWLSIVIFQVQS